MGYRIVVAGATGNVGREMLNILAEREFPIDEIAVVASSRSQGLEVEFGVFLKTEGYIVNRKRVQRLMQIMGLAAIAPGPNTCYVLH